VESDGCRGLTKLERQGGIGTVGQAGGGGGGEGGRGGGPDGRRSCCGRLLSASSPPELRYYTGTVTWRQQQGGVRLLFRFVVFSPIVHPAGAPTAVNSECEVMGDEE
jgi:hypothetical protein